MLLFSKFSLLLCFKTDSRKYNNEETPVTRTITYTYLDENGNEQLFGGFALDKKNKILNTKLLIYECEGTESEIKEWFRTINIAGVPLNNQELLNAVYSGPFVTLGKEEFSNSKNSNIQKWSAYISGSANRQDFLERALICLSKDLSSLLYFVFIDLLWVERDTDLRF